LRGQSRCASDVAVVMELKVGHGSLRAKQFYRRDDADAEEKGAGPATNESSLWVAQQMAQDDD
jgi:hypothetical protein